MKLKLFVRKMCREYNKELGAGLSDNMCKNAASMVFIRTGLNEDDPADGLSSIERISIMKVCRSTVSMYSLSEKNQLE